MAVFDKPAGWPPFFPLALAESKPAFVLSRIISRSNSASDAKMLKVNLPVGVAVLMPF
jgi:hypothetical protein